MNISRRGALFEASAMLSLPLLAQGSMQGLLHLAQAKEEPRDWLFVPTPRDVVEKMLEMAKVTKDDLVVDLGSGDGRIPIAAAEIYGARGRGVDINPVRVEEARENARASKVEHLVTFEQGDVFKVPIADATVVALYMFQHITEKLGERFRKELKPGTRIVSHRFTLGADWPPVRTENVRDHIPVHLWIA